MLHESWKMQSEGVAATRLNFPKSLLGAPYHALFCSRHEMYLCQETKLAFVAKLCDRQPGVLLRRGYVAGNEVSTAREAPCAPCAQRSLPSSQLRLGHPGV